MLRLVVLAELRMNYCKPHFDTRLNNKVWDIVSGMKWIAVSAGSTVITTHPGSGPADTGALI
jgi:hypothetical protein